MKISTFIIIAFVFSGCTIQQPVAEHKYQEHTPLNQEFTKEIGETLTEYTDAYFINAIKITKGSKVKSVSFDPVKPGEIFPSANRVNNTQYYLIADPQIPTGRGISINEKTGLQKFVQGEIYNLISYNLETPLEYEKIKVPDSKRDFYRMQFIYNGKSGNTLKFTYREFVNENARPAFTQDVQYDLSESKIIGFKGMRIDVLDASNTNIKYKILNPFTH